MSLSYVEHARAVRARLMNPPNAVVDTASAPVVKSVPFAPRHPTVTQPKEFVPEPFEIRLESGRHVRSGYAPSWKQRQWLQYKRDDLPVFKVPSVKRVMEVVCRAYSISNVDVCGKARTKTCVVPRQIIYYLLRDVCGKSFPEIGRALGGRDHTSAMSGYRKVSQMIQIDDYFSSRVAQLRAAVESEVSI